MVSGRLREKGHHHLLGRPPLMLKFILTDVQRTTDIRQGVSHFLTMSYGLLSRAIEARIQLRRFDSALISPGTRKGSSHSWASGVGPSAQWHEEVYDSKLLLSIRTFQRDRIGVGFDADFRAIVR